MGWTGLSSDGSDSRMERVVVLSRGKSGIIKSGSFLNNKGGDNQKVRGDYESGWWVLKRRRGVLGYIN